MNRNIRTQMWILFGMLLANWVAQIVYFRHLYYTPEHPFPTLRNTLPFLSLFVMLIVGYALLLLHRKTGYYLLTFYLALQFFFYLWNTVGGVIHGYGLFFHLSEPDPILWAVFNIGYLSFLASGYFLFLLLYKRVELLHGAG